MVKEFFNARFADVEKGAWYPEGTRLLVRDGVITDLIRPGQSGPTSSDSNKPIDLKGGFVLPGLVNSHCHLSMVSPTFLPDMKALGAAREHAEAQSRRNLRECLSRGITTVRDAWSADLSVTRRLKEAVQSGQIPGPRILQSVVVSPPESYLSARPTLFGRMARSLAGLSDKPFEDPDSGTVVFKADAGEAQVREAVDRAVDERGAECVKIAEQDINVINFKPAAFMTQAQLSALTEQARVRGKQTLMHQVSLASFRRGLKAGVRCLSHMPRDAFLEEADIAACLEAGVVMEPTLSVAYDACWPMDGDPFAHHPNMVRLSVFREARFESQVNEFYVPGLTEAALRTLSAFRSGQVRVMGLLNMKKLFAYYSPMVGCGMGNYLRLAEAGVPMTCANDGGIPPCTPAMVGNELDLMDLFSGGIPPAERIRRATVFGARALGQEDNLGVIGPGKRADLVVYRDDPYLNPGLVGGRASAVYTDGVAAPIVNMESC